MREITEYNKAGQPIGCPALLLYYRYLLICRLLS